MKQAGRAVARESCPLTPGRSAGTVGDRDWNLTALLQHVNKKMQICRIFLDRCENAVMIASTMETYLTQLDTRCQELGIDLQDICRAEGIADTTLARWRKGESTCREGTAKVLFARMRKMAAGASPVPSA